MRLQRQMQVAVVVDHVLADRHGGQGEIGLLADIVMGGDVEERQPVVLVSRPEAARRP